MIPKKIHYCWFGGKKMPLRFRRYIKSWKKYCPDYEIIEWNEKNYDINKSEFMAEAAAQKKWAFVSDYARLDIVYQHGGIYLDTDVELLKSFDLLLEYKGFAGFECSDHVNFGLGVGAEAGNRIIKEILDFYTDAQFNQDFIKNNTCPVVQTRVLKQHGLISDRTKEQDIEGFHIFPTEYFCPMNYSQIYDNLTKNTYSVHHFAASWFSKKEKCQFLWGNFKTKLKFKIKKMLSNVKIHGGGITIT